jgi:hypothetical protein
MNMHSARWDEISKISSHHDTRSIMNTHIKFNSLRLSRLSLSTHFTMYFLFILVGIYLEYNKIISLYIDIYVLFTSLLIFRFLFRLYRFSSNIKSQNIDKYCFIRYLQNAETSISTGTLIFLLIDLVTTKYTIEYIIYNSILCFFLSIPCLEYFYAICCCKYVYLEPMNDKEKEIYRDMMEKNDPPIIKTIKWKDKTGTCALCSKNLNINEKVVIYDCYHIMHNKCTKLDTCPLCSTLNLVV